MKDILYLNSGYSTVVEFKESLPAVDSIKSAGILQIDFPNSTVGNTVKISFGNGTPPAFDVNEIELDGLIQSLQLAKQLCFKS